MPFQAKNGALNRQVVAVMSRLPLFLIGLIGCASIRPLPAASSPPMTSLIVQAGAPVLRKRATEVEPQRIQTPEFQKLIETMISTMRAAPGVGLAAPQIGIPLRVIVLEDREELMSKLAPDERRERERVAFKTRVFINPTLGVVGGEHAMFFEGCLSVNGYVGLVERSLEVEVSGLDEHATLQTWRVRGWPARILQHEIDHIDGALYIDRMKTRSFTAASHAKELYGGKSIAEIRKRLGL